MNTQTRYGSAVVTLPSDTEILITRLFDASAEKLFAAWTTPALVKQWWSYSEDQWRVCDIDLRVGGMWRWVIVHRNDNGEFDVAFHGIYRDIDAPRSLVYTEVFEGAPAPDPDASPVVNTLRFSEADGITTMSLHSQCPDPLTRDAIIESGMEHGMQISFDRMEDLARA